MNDLLNTITEHSPALMSKIMSYCAVFGVSTGLTLGAVNDTSSKIFSPSLWTIADVAAVMSVITSIAALAYYLQGLYYRRKNKGGDL